MPRQEVKCVDPANRDNLSYGGLYLYRLIPSQRRHLSLKLLAANGAMSHNALYCKTSPACIREGYTRSIGTYNDTVLNTLVKANLIKVEYKYRGKQPPAWSKDMSQEDFMERHQARFRKVSSYTITSMGQLALVALNDNKLINFDSDADIKSVSDPGEY